MKEKFTEYCNEYNNIRDSFFGINNFIVKVKKLFNINDLNKKKFQIIIVFKLQHFI